ncbi:Ribosomal_L19 domain-containing protein [Cephalotus follicularis]|uniref:Ribosomal_L19 domain-containing protein n=1 Tax=Cephalotus follicularis TaxID=3775 RepID=A0A1Q3BAV5_CEPFO|nr:Ribosomal_L19 domain-containing protein [Cephalotus follicularis]
MQSLYVRIRLVSKNVHFQSTRALSCLGPNYLASKVDSPSKNHLFHLLHKFASRSPLPSQAKFVSERESSIASNGNITASRPGFFQVVPPYSRRSITTVGNSVQSAAPDSTASVLDVPPRIKFKRLDKTARNIMQILDKEAVKEVNTQREIPDIRPGYIVQLKVVVPENKRRVSTLKGIVIARRNAGLNTTFRIRRLVAGIGVESLFPLYSPNIKEIKVLEKRPVRRAKLYYLRDKMNALKKR